ncbi:hypothetical protein BHYA_0163g00100 [Botrytis hyacinthi]|uniref:Uncharacterized protein n=1 Tax=Botrytis hyacinthi TaxID=278943 RepID=A0A4Z1GF05_9HELO|nr:hypothetical protein BHYA_0163g00100 [Botrytis hyacinthi]
MNLDNFSTALPVTRNKKNVDSGYASQESSPPSDGSKSSLTGRAIAKGKSILPNHIRMPKHLRSYDRPIPQLTWDRFSDLREQYAESLNSLTRVLPDCTSVLMTLKVLGENEESAEPWRRAIKCDFEPLQADDFFPRLSVYIHPHKLRPLAKSANTPPQFDPLADSNNHDIYMELSDIALGARYGTKIMTEYSRRVRQASMGDLIEATDQEGAKRIFRMTAGHFVLEGSYDDGVSEQFCESDDDSDGDSLTTESFELDLSTIEANSEENHVYMASSPEIEVDGKVNIDKWPRGLITIRKHFYDLLNAPSSFDTHQASAECDKRHSIAEMKSARGPLQGILSSSWSYIMLPPGKVLIRTYLLSLSGGPNLQAGDSGAWIVDSISREVLGHVVTSDVLGHGYVVPRHFSVVPVYSMDLLDSNGTGKINLLKKLMGNGYNIGSDGEYYVPLALRFSRPDSDSSTMVYIDKEVQRREIVYLKLEERIQEEEIELSEAGEEPNEYKDLEVLKKVCNIARQYYLIGKAEVRNDMELAALLKKKLEKLLGHDDSFVSSKSDTTASHELSSAHDTKRPTRKRGPEGEIDEGKGSI